MARIRSIKPEFPQSESMGNVSRDARLLFILLWPICDDHGRTRAASRMLASTLFPYDDDAKGLIDTWLDELERENCIRRYHVNGSAYLEIRNWLTHQKIDKPSKPQFPEPSDNPREYSRAFVVGREGKGEERKGEEASAAPPKKPPAPADDSPIVVSIPLNTGEDFPVTANQVREFSGLYPAVDVAQALRGMRAWCVSNPAKRKTRGGVMRFVNAWLAKEQNNGHGARAPTPIATCRKRA